MLLSFSLCAGFVCSAVATAPASEEAPRSEVSTLAGNGRIGVAEGDALDSSFVLPAGVSVAPDQSILIADPGANAIYRLANGRVSRVAGKTKLADDSEGAVGAYVDGPIASAEFNRPVAAIERSDGAIFVADSQNRCIRLIQAGRVSTFAGLCTAFGAADGSAHVATFKSPTGLAFDADGNLLVSDFGVGIRRVDKNGQVSTLPIGKDGNDILSIAAAAIGGHQLIAYTQVRAIHLVLDGKDQTLAADRDRLPERESVPVFTGWGIAILNQNTVAVTDVMTSVIRLIRFPSLPFTNGPASEAISGTLHEDTDFHGGFRDGSATEALYDGPRGICVDRQGRLIIADTGNRRIRRLAGFSSRETVLPDFSNYAVKPGEYDIVLIGSSALFNGVLWPDSTPGVLESTLSRAAPAAGLRKPVHVEAIRADGVDFAAMASFANEFVLSGGHVDTIAFMLASLTDPPVDDVVAEANLLAKSNVKFEIAVMPYPTAVSIQDTPYKPCGCILTAADIEADRLNVQAVEFAYRNAGLTTVPLLDRIIQAERAPIRTALYNMFDNHLSVAGQRLVGTIFADAMLRERPWERALAQPIAQQDTTSFRSCPRAAAAAGPPTVGHLETIKADEHSPPLTDGDSLSADATLTLSGWASDQSQRKTHRGLCVLVDGFSGYPARGSANLLRLDVVHTFGHRELAASGFSLSIKPGALQPGHHAVGIGVVQADGRLLEAPGAVGVEIK
jgi:hypothetical protein